MVGFYADPPGYRMALDQDGTVGVSIWPDGSTHMLAVDDMQHINNEDISFFSLGETAGVDPKLAYVFPELRDITAIYVAAGSGYVYNEAKDITVETSVDTTNGVDGTWVSQAVLSVTTDYTSVTHNRGTTVAGTIKPDYRLIPHTLIVSGIRGIRITPTLFYAPGGYDIYDFHVYGSIAAGQNPDRLAIWQPVTNARISSSYFDFGDVERASVTDKTFRVKNLSASLTANTITVALDFPTDADVSLVSQFKLSNGGAYGATTSAGTLAPGAISGILTLRDTADTLADLSLWSGRLYAQAASWS